MSKARREILKLMNEYCYRIDAGDLDGFAAMFEKSNFEIIGDPSGPMVGSAPVRAMLENVTLYDGKPQSKHVLSNVQIDVDGDSATAQSYVTVMQALPDFPLQAIFIGHYFDNFQKGDDGWYFTSRRISPDLIGDLSRHRADMA